MGNEMELVVVQLGEDFDPAQYAGAEAFAGVVQSLGDAGVHDEQVTKAENIRSDHPAAVFFVVNPGSGVDSFVENPASEGFQVNGTVDHVIQCPDSIDCVGGVHGGLWAGNSFHRGKPSGK
jgi:hypothetical protein